MEMRRKRKTTGKAMEKCRKRQKSEPVEDQKTEQSQSTVQNQPEPRKIAVEKPEYFTEKRNLEDLWQHVFSVGTEWENMNAVYKQKWDFSNLEAAFEEGGELHDKKVFLFGSTESPSKERSTLAPVVVAVVSPFPPSDKIGIESVQREVEEIVPMKQMKMDWIPYISLDNRLSQVERLKNSQIFVLSCTQRRAALRHLKIDRVKDFEYCLPYFYNPLREDDFLQSTSVSILYPIDGKPPARVIVEFDWESYGLEEFTDDLIEEEELPADQKEPFKEFVREEVRKARRENREEREARKRAREEMSESRKAAFQNMKILKFYPVSMPDSPEASLVKCAYINRYYGKAHKVI